MKRKSGLILTTIFGLGLLLTSCQNNDSKAQKDPLDENYKLIDKGEYSQAIDSLTELSRTDSRPQVRVALASAYAARGGVKVETYWGFLVGFKAPLVKAENVKVNATIDSLQRISKQVKGDMDPKDMEALGGIVRTLSVWDRYKERVDAIPVVKGAALDDLRTSIGILGNVETPGGRLYRAILNLIAFKSYVVASQGFWDDFNKSVEKVIQGDIRVLCKFDFDKVNRWLQPLSYHLVSTMDDLIIAFPKERADFISARDLVSEVYTVTNKAVTELREKRMCL